MKDKQFEYINKFDKSTKVTLKTNESIFSPTATTDFLIKGVAENIKYVDKLLDLGCGNGIVGITLSKILKVKTIYCSDISKEAVKITNINIKLNNIEGIAISSDIFSNWSNHKFNVIVNDISGISDEIANISKWFSNVPCNSGIDGSENTQKVLKESKKFLAKEGKLFFPIISLSNGKKIFQIAEQCFKNVSIISHNKWFLPDDFLHYKSTLIRLKKKGSIDYCEKFGKLICWTDIYMAY